MTRIKVCGIKRSSDVDCLNELLPDYAGFVFARSRRAVGLREAGELIGALDSCIGRVGVFQDQELETVRHYAECLKLDVIQLHGNESEEYIDALRGFRIWRVGAIEAGVASSLEKLDRICSMEVEAVLLDSCAGGARGGSGISFDWNLLQNLKTDKNLILAGGLNLQNVEKAIGKVKPWCVDVSSGVEEDGMKSYKKIKYFIEKVRSIK
ncbi:MAG: N-(5-phosphoribosyl)anthranilate isomerase [Firmicutes bacterium]|nr:N-(5-phosphoribosyl)anthranilate isomerase [Bacillota bacterium]